MLRVLLLSVLLGLFLLPTTTHAQASYQVLYLNDAGQVIALDPQTGVQTILITVENPLAHAVSLYPAPDGSAVAIYVRLTDLSVSPPHIEARLYVISLPDAQTLLDQNLLLPDYAYPSSETLGDPAYELTRALGEVVWSPDSHAVAFISAHEGSGDVFLFESAGQAISRLYDAQQTAAFINWSPDSDALAVAELSSFGNGSGYQGIQYVIVKESEIRPIPLPEPANQTGISIVGWRDNDTLIYAPLNFAVYGANGIYALDLASLTSTELLPPHIALNIPEFDPQTSALAFVVPDVGDLNLAPGAYLWQTDDSTPSLVQSGTFYTVEAVQPAIFQFEAADGSFLVDASLAEPALIPLPQHDFGAYISPAQDAVVLSRADGVYISHISLDDTALVWAEETQVPIWSPDGGTYYSFGFAPEGAGLVEVNVISRSLRLLDSRMAVNSPRAIAP